MIMTNQSLRKRYKMCIRDRIQVFGIDHTIPTVKENIGVVFDECNFHDVFTAADIEDVYKRQHMRSFPPSAKPVAT